MNIDLLRLAAENAIQQKAFPGGVLISGTSNAIDLEISFGRHTYDLSSPKTELNNYFDLASLTKVVATTPAIMALIDNGQINLNDKIGKYLPDNWFITDAKKRDIQVIDLLAHCSGLPACCPLEILNNKELTKEQLWQFIYFNQLLFAPKTDFLYSDIGFIMLGKIVELVSEMPLDKFVHANIFVPLKMLNSTFSPSYPKNQIVPTEYTPDGILLQGVVHDECTRVLGASCGHAGVFSNAYDLAKYATAWLENTDSIPCLENIAVQFSKKAKIINGSTRALGWDTVSINNKEYTENTQYSAGNFIDYEAFGHTGFVGNSIWISRKYNRYMIILTNQVYPKRDNVAVRLKQYWRNKLTNIAWELLGYKKLNNLPQLTPK